MIDRKECMAYKYKVGFNEGRIDCLFANNLTTIEDRAVKTFHTMGFKTYKKYFVDGYIEAANGKEKERWKEL